MCILRFNNQDKAESFIKSKLEKSLNLEELNFFEKIVKLCSYKSTRLFDSSYLVDIIVLDNCINIITKEVQKKEIQ